MCVNTEHEAIIHFTQPVFTAPLFLSWRQSNTESSHNRIMPASPITLNFLVAELWGEALAQGDLLPIVEALACKPQVCLLCFEGKCLKCAILEPPH